MGDLEALKAEMARLAAEHAATRNEVASLRAEVSQLRAEVCDYRETLLFVGQHLVTGARRPTDRGPLRTPAATGGAL